MKYPRLSPLFLAACLMLTPLGSLSPQPAHAAGFGMRSGSVTSITPKAITLLGSDGQAQTYPIADGAFVSLDGKPAKMEDLKPGQQARVALGAGRVTSIYATTTTISAFGKIGAITSSSVTLWEPAGGGVTATFPITPDTKFTLYGQPAAIGDVRAGMLATITTIDNATAIVAIQKPSNALTDGKISTISAKSITVGVQLNDDVTYAIAAETYIFLDGKPATVSQLRDKQIVRVTSDDGVIARTISALTRAPERGHHGGYGN